MAAYELRTLDLPKLTGAGLKIFTRLVENPASRLLLINSLLENGGIHKLRRTILEEPPTLYPLVKPGARDRETPVVFEPVQQPTGLPYRTIRDYATAYRQGDFSPLEAARRVLAAVEASEEGNAPLRAFIAINREDVLRQADEATERIKSGKELSMLDGVPIGVKDEIDMQPYPTTVGTRFLGKDPAVQDSTVVARLRAAGALLVGKTNMHEIGITPNGFNAHHGAVRNPFNDQYDPGGSSSGSGAAVAAGLVPAALGADGGGSIRIPAALCGVVGLKSTFGRVSEFGAAPLCWSVAHLGPLAVSVEDVAFMYSLIAGPDPRDPNTQLQPPVTLAGWNQTDLRGLRLGIDRAWFEHASPGVVQACKALLEQLRGRGAEVCEISIPALDEMRIAHAVTILSEMAACMQDYRAQRSLHDDAVRLSLLLGSVFTAGDYLKAQRIRTRALAIFADIFQDIDVILSPATAQTAPLIPVEGLSSGWSDLGADTELMRFVFPGNLVGLPAISFPAGYDDAGLPIGMQAMGRHWQEHLLLRVAYTAEQFVQRHKAERYWEIF
jgi:Asp-tRNA(Asn)/Glu-tRNA(Gln) amidotransferase A subunit family amidase